MTQRSVSSPDVWGICASTESYIEFSRPGHLLRLEPVSERMIRVVHTLGAPVVDRSMMIEMPPHACDPFIVTEDPDSCTLETKHISVKLDLHTGALLYTDRISGELFVTMPEAEVTETEVIKYDTGDEAPVVERIKTVDGERNFIKNLRPHTDRTACRAKLPFSFADDEGIYGLGQAEEGIYNYRHQNQYLYQHNMRTPMPCFISSRHYGILANCSSLLTFNDDARGSYLFLDTVTQAEYYFIAGRDVDQIVDGIRTLTGQAAMLPKWAYGYVQSKERYVDETELVDAVRKYRELQIPLDCIVEDWNTWENGKWGNKHVDKSRFGHLKEAIDEIHDMHVHTMISVWPNMNSGTEDHTEFQNAGYLLNDLCTYDAFAEKARDIYWKQAKSELFNSGFDSWWCDSTEPFSGPDWKGAVKKEPWERYALVGQEHKNFLDPEAANGFAYMHAKGMYENQRRETEQKRVLNLSRSGYTGIQKYGVMLWSGDIDAKWDTLKRQIVEGLNVGLSGYPYWTLDIGAFFTVGKTWQNRGCGCNTDPTPKWFWQGEYDEGINDPAYCELYVRWLQMGCFLPMFRSHGTDTPREIWNFGQEGDPFYDAIARFIRLRYRLMPYIYSLQGDVTLRNGTIMRSLLFDFPADAKAVALTDTYMFGPAFLVSVVTEPMYYDKNGVTLTHPRKKTCYLPAGTTWYDFWTNTKYNGGQEVPVDTPIDRMPLFIRAGSIIPMQENLQYADQLPTTPMQIAIYPGADGSFILYEDEGDGYGYESGQYSTIRLTWDDAASTLTIAPRHGSYPGMPETRTLTLMLGSAQQEVHYNGSETKFSFHSPLPR